MQEITPRRRRRGRRRRDAAHNLVAHGDRGRGVDGKRRGAGVLVRAPGGRIKTEPRAGDAEAVGIRGKVGRGHAQRKRGGLGAGGVLVVGNPVRDATGRVLHRRGEPRVTVVFEVRGLQIERELIEHDPGLGLGRKPAGRAGPEAGDIADDDREKSCQQRRDRRRHEQFQQRKGAARFRRPRGKTAGALSHRFQRFTAPATNNESFELWSKRTAPAGLAPTCCAPAPESATKAGQRMRAV